MRWLPVSCLVTSWLAYVTLADARADRRQSQVARIAVERQVRMAQALLNIGRSLVALRGLYLASEKVEQDEFVHFAEGIRDRSFHALMWVPRTAMRKGQADPEQPWSYPVRYVEPMASPGYPLGSDLAADPVCQPAMWQAAAEAKPVATNVRQTVGADQLEMLVFLPYYGHRQVPETIVARQEQLQGFLVVVVRMGELFHAALDEVHRDGVAVSWFAESADSVRQEIGSNGSESEAVGVTVAKITQFGRRYWLRTAVAESALSSGLIGPVFVLVWGVSLTLLLAAYLSALGNRNRRVTQLVAERTSELEASRRDLLAEVDVRREAEVRAAQADSAKTAFLANMSYELRTPMTAILGYTDILLEDDVPEESVEVVRIVQRNGRHLLSLLNDILDLSKIEAGYMECERIAVSPCEVLEEVTGLMRVRANQKRLAFEVEVDPSTPPQVWTDPTKLRQILVNLIGNAIKFTEEGTVTVRVSASSSDGDACGLRFEVSDTGIGMDSTQLAKVFEPFAQADRSMTRRFGGTGLGLALCKRLVDLMHGSIDVECELGKGCLFKVELPVSVRREQRPKVSAQTDTRSTGTDLEGLRVLLVEDGPDNQMLIRRILQKAGMEVEVRENGLLALERLLDQQGKPSADFDLVLLDMQMPELDGYQTAKRLREAGFEVPICALTAHAMAADERKCLDAGCDEYATKPIDRADLFSKMRRLTAPAK